MKITICGSMTFAKEMLEIKDKMEQAGHVIFIPKGTQVYADDQVASFGGVEGSQRKIAHDLIRRHYNLINDSDAIVVVNHEKKGIKNYIGGSSFLEIGYAYILGKKIFLINDIPEIELIKQEIEAMQPLVINGDLEKII